MTELKGKYTDCKIFSETVDQSSISQVYDFLNHPAFKGCKTRFMPDIHAGSGAVIGTTVELGDKIIPNVIGVDIGCGMLSVNIGSIDIDFQAMDLFIRKEIPSGFSVNRKVSNCIIPIEKDVINICKKIGEDPHRHLLSAGSLGGGNHFIEIGEDESKNKWLTIHSGSRNFGLKVAKYHQNIAVKKMRRPDIDLSGVAPEDRQSYREKFISETPKIKTGMEYLIGTDAENYFQDMKIAQEFASISRLEMASRILHFLGLTMNLSTKIESIHNYIDFEDKIIRKGAISAKKNEFVVIPWNMRDGLIIGKGKGNPDWNYSAPHGAGRLMSRSKAKKEIAMEEFRESMAGIFTTCVSEGTLDESPMAYKDHYEVEKYLGETVEILHRVIPIYNFKAS